MSKPEGKTDLEQRQFPERVQLIPFSSVSSIIFKEKSCCLSGIQPEEVQLFKLAGHYVDIRKRRWKGKRVKSLKLFIYMLCQQIFQLDEKQIKH